MLACKQCGEVRTISRTFRAGTVVYTLRFFACKHPRAPETEKARSVTAPPILRR